MELKLTTKQKSVIAYIASDFEVKHHANISKIKTQMGEMEAAYKRLENVLATIEFVKENTLKGYTLGVLSEEIKLSSLDGAPILHDDRIEFTILTE